MYPFILLTILSFFVSSFAEIINVFIKGKFIVINSLPCFSVVSLQITIIHEICGANSNFRMARRTAAKA